jgi:hypothetical protein
LRKQHHFRESERGLLAWDIDHLVELAEGFEVKRIPLSEIRELHEEYWFAPEIEHAARMGTGKWFETNTVGFKVEKPYLLSCLEVQGSEKLLRTIRAEQQGKTQ